MIIITEKVERVFHVMPGDSFQLTINDKFGASVIIDEEITKIKTIDFIASFRFALEDGTCPCFHLAGIFANSNELPKEIKEAVHVKDLTRTQYLNFIQSAGVKINGK